MTDSQWSSSALQADVTDKVTLSPRYRDECASVLVALYHAAVRAARIDACRGSRLVTLPAFMSPFAPDLPVGAAYIGADMLGLDHREAARVLLNAAFVANERLISELMAVACGPLGLDFDEVEAMMAKAADGVVPVARQLDDGDLDEDDLDGPDDE